MIWSVLIACIVVLQCSWWGYCMHSLLHVKNERSRRDVLLAWLVYILWNLSIKVLPLPLENPSYINVIGALTINIGILQYLYSDSLRRKGFVIAFFYAMVFIAELMVELANMNLFLAYEEEIFSAAGSPYRIPMMLECLVLCASIYLLIQLLVKNARYNMLEIKDFRLPLLLFPFIFCLTMLFINENLRFNNDMFYNASFYIQVILTIVLMTMWLLWTWIQHAQMQLHLKLEQERELRELEHFQYQEVLKKREHLDKICKDYRVQLQEIQGMIRQRQIASADSRAVALTHELQATKEMPYCSIPVLNALLAEKERECREKKLKLNTELTGINKLPLADMEEEDLRQLKIQLCSIFSNLLDNSIRALDTCTLPDYDSEIRLMASRQGEYLAIRTANASDVPEPTPRPGHGLGTRILTEIAHKREGQYVTQYKDGQFVATVLLKVSV